MTVSPAGIEKSRIMEAVRTAYQKGNRNREALIVAACTGSTLRPEEALRTARNTFDTISAVDAPCMEETHIEYAPDTVPRLAVEPDKNSIIDGLAVAITEGTKLPFSFARETFKMMLMASLPVERPILPWFHKLHGRQYIILVSDNPHDGKGETFRRCSETLRKASFNVEFIPGHNLGSPEYACVKLGGRKAGKAKQDDKGGIEVAITPPDGRVIHYDEGTVLFQKDSVGGSATRGLLTMFTSLFESNQHATGSFKNGEFFVDGANASLSMHFTRAGFDKCFLGSGTTRDGFLSRCTIVADRPNPVQGDWKQVSSESVSNLMEAARACLNRTVIEEQDGARQLRLEYAAKLRGADPQYGSRLEFLFVQDLYARAMFDVAQAVISADHVKHAIAWTEHQLLTRRVLWPFDSSSDKQERMYFTLRAAYQEHKRLTHAQAKRLCNVGREGSGGIKTYEVVHRSLLGTKEITQVGTNRKRQPIFELAD